MQQNYIPYYVMAYMQQNYVYTVLQCYGLHAP